MCNRVLNERSPDICTNAWNGLCWTFFGSHQQIYGYSWTCVHGIYIVIVPGDSRTKNIKDAELKLQYTQWGWAWCWKVPGEGLLPVTRVLGVLFAQETTGEKTNNGIHYRLQLLYSNGEVDLEPGPNKIHTRYRNKHTHYTDTTQRLLYKTNKHKR